MIVIIFIKILIYERYKDLLNSYKKDFDNYDLSKIHLNIIFNNKFYKKNI
jgi:hypothetical protein